MPDITTLHRLAEILGADLNYFFGQFPSFVGENSTNESLENQSTEWTGEKQRGKQSWNMSLLNLRDGDFSRLKNLHEKFRSSNMQNCLLVGSEMSGLLLINNHVARCDFSNSDIRKSQIRNSNLENNQFINCSLSETEFTGSSINNCNFTCADFTGATLKLCSLVKNTVTHTLWKHTQFMDTHIVHIIFEGTLDDCTFENCTFTNATFQNTTFRNTFFKNNRKMKKVKFIDCKADKLSFAFLKNNQAHVTGISLLPE